MVTATRTRNYEPASDGTWTSCLRPVKRQRSDATHSTLPASTSTEPAAHNTARRRKTFTRKATLCRSIAEHDAESQPPDLANVFDISPVRPAFATPSLCLSGSSLSEISCQLSKPQSLSRAQPFCPITSPSADQARALQRNNERETHRDREYWDSKTAEWDKSEENSNALFLQNTYAYHTYSPRTIYRLEALARCDENKWPGPRISPPPQVSPPERIVFEIVDEEFGQKVQSAYRNSVWKAGLREDKYGVSAARTWKRGFTPEEFRQGWEQKVARDKAEAEEYSDSDCSARKGSL